MVLCSSCMSGPPARHPALLGHKWRREGRTGNAGESGCPGGRAEGRQGHSVVSALVVWGKPGTAEAVVVGHAGCESGREAGGPAQGTACLEAPLSSSSSSPHICSLALAEAVAEEVVAVGPPRSEDPPRWSSALGRGCCLEHRWRKLVSPAGICCLGGTCLQVLWPLCQKVYQCHPHSLYRAEGCNSPWPAAAADHSLAQPDPAACSSPGAMSPVRFVGSFAVCHGNHTFLEKTA